MPLAPPMTPQPGPAAPVSPPTGSPGLEAAAIAQVREAVSILEKQLPALTTGSDKYKAVLDSISKLSKVFPSSGAVPGIQKTALAGLMQKAQSDAMMRQTIAKGQQGGGAPGGAAPAMPASPAPMGQM